MSKKLLFSVSIADMEIQTFTAGGKGGQRQNRKETGVRLIHPPSGARGEARDSRNQLENKRAAFARLVGSREFTAWHRLETAKRLGLIEDLDKRVEAMLSIAPDIKIEVRTKDGWTDQTTPCGCLYWPGCACP